MSLLRLLLPVEDGRALKLHCYCAPARRCRATSLRPLFYHHYSFCWTSPAVRLFLFVQFLSRFSTYGYTYSIFLCCYTRGCTARYGFEQRLRGGCRVDDQLRHCLLVDVATLMLGTT